MIFFLVVGLIVMALVIYGFFTAGNTRGTVVPIARSLSSEDARRSSVSLELSDENESLVSKIHRLSAEGYRICFDDEILLAFPDLLKDLNEDVNITVAKDVLDTLEGFSRTAKHGFKVKQITSILSTRSEKKICLFDDNYLNNLTLSSDIVSNRVIGAYVKDQNSGLHFNVLVSKRPDWCSLARRNGLKFLLIE